MSDNAPTSGAGSSSSTQLNLSPKAITAIVILAVAVIFVFSNTGDLTLHFLWFSIQAPGWVMLAALFAGGLAVGFFLGRNRYRQ